MNLSQALRLIPPPSLRNSSPKSGGFGGGWEGVAFVGSGGKSTALFELARELPSPVIVTTTTHLHIDQIRLADSHLIVEKPEDFSRLEEYRHGVILVTGPLAGERTTGLNDTFISRLHAICESHRIPLLIEADGSKRKALKAPADHEPVIPQFVGTVVVVAGLSGLGKPLTEEFVHRPEIFGRLGGLKLGTRITPEALLRVLADPAGGLKEIPTGACRILLLNQCDTSELQAEAKLLAGKLIPPYQAVIISSLNPQLTISNQKSQIHAVYEPVAGIILAAGGSSRFGQPKALLDWHGTPFIRAVAETALTAGLSPVIVVTGAHAEQVETAVNDLPVNIVRNQDWQSGQSSSIRTGLTNLFLLPPFSLGSTPKPQGEGRGWEGVGAAIFLLADQPQVPPTVLRALCEEHGRTLAPIVAPLVQGQRANPVLFDRLTFPDLMELSGDVGGRAVFSKFQVDYLAWHDQGLLVDVDTPAEYRKLIDGE